MTKIDTEQGWLWLTRGLGGIVNMMLQTQELYGKLPQKAKMELINERNRINNVLANDELL